MGMCRRRIDPLNLPIGTLSLAGWLSHTPEGKKIPPEFSMQFVD
jgi:hypothetical protein